MVTKQDKDTLKLLEDLIRRVVREELERHRPSAPLFDGRGGNWIASTDPAKHWGLDIPSNGPGTPAG